MSAMLLKTKRSSPYLPHCVFFPRKSCNLADLRAIIAFWAGLRASSSRFRSDSFTQLCCLCSSAFVAGKYHCPVLYSVFSNNSHIVANKVTGNVFSYEVGEVFFSSDHIACVLSESRHFSSVHFKTNQSFYTIRLWSNSTSRQNLYETFWLMNPLPERIS